LPTVAAFLLMAAAAQPPVAGAVGETIRASVPSGGGQGNGGSAGGLSAPAIGANGRFVAFASQASNLVATDSNGKTDVFVRDVQAGATARVSVSSAGEQGNGDSGLIVGERGGLAISADGRFVAFASQATNLVAGDTNGDADVFVYDRQTATTVRVSLTNTAAQANDPSVSPVISGDGRFVAFTSAASNLVAGDNNFADDVFVRDTVGGTTTRVNVSTAGTQTAEHFSSGNAAISADGRFVAFQSLAANLISGDNNGVEDVFVHDRQTLVTERVSLTNAGNQITRSSTDPAISADGRFVAFVSNPVTFAGDPFVRSVFVRDRMMSTTTRASVSSNGLSGNQDKAHPAISADGRFVAFATTDSFMVPGDDNGFGDIFIRDLENTETSRISLDSAGGQVNGHSTVPAISSDGRFIAFKSLATNLVPGDTNGVQDVFRHDRTPPPPPPAATVSYSASSGLSITDHDGASALFGVSLSGALPPVYSVGHLASTVKPIAGTGCTSGTATVSCSVTGSNVVTVDLGDLADGLNPAACAGSMGEADVGGGDGNDTLLAGPGRDAIHGEDGNDTLGGCAGKDQLDGGAGNDVLQAAATESGDDVLTGGGGTDRADYLRSGAVIVKLDGQANDGATGEGDDVDVENVNSGGGSDGLVGDTKTNRLSGGDGNDNLIGGSEPKPSNPNVIPVCATFGNGPCGDVLTGGEGGDDLFGQGNDDILEGGNGVDVLSGGDDDDTLGSRDGIKDTVVNCGAGTDTAKVDLLDQPSSSCENVDQGAVGEGPYLAIRLKHRLRLTKNRRLAVPVACPLTLRHSCVGRLAVAASVAALKGAPTTRYRVAAGKAKLIRPLAGRAVHRGGRVFVQSVESGDVKGEKTKRRLGRVARARR
jgi:Tol biopolymer transport system component